MNNWRESIAGRGKSRGGMGLFKAEVPDCFKASRRTMQLEEKTIVE